MDNLPRSTPAEQGVDARGIDAFVAALDAAPGVEQHSLMVLRHGHVIAERWWAPYRPESPHLLYSLSKSFTSTALGFAVAEGLVDLDATVLSYFPEWHDRVTDPRARSIRLRDVASMASGHDDETIEEAIRAGAGDMTLGLLLLPPEHDPGSHFAYNQPCTNAISAVVRRASGASLSDFLRTRLFEPLAIDSYGWWPDPVGRELGYSGLFVTTSAIAKLGQLYLDRGVWQGRQLLPASWVDEATRLHVANHQDNPDWRQGYGFQFWRSRHGYRGDGAYGQFMVILPEADAVVAMTGQSPDMQAVLDALWTHLLPALTAGPGPAGAWPTQTPALPGPALAGPALPGPALAGPGPGLPGLLGPASSGPPLSEAPVPGPAVSGAALSGPGGGIPAATFRAGAGSEPAGLTEVRTRPGELSADGITVALGVPGEWTATGPIATDHAWVAGRLLIDVVFAETPHRLHLALDPAAGTFTGRWQTEPLGPVPPSGLRSPARG